MDYATGLSGRARFALEHNDVPAARRLHLDEVVLLVDRHDPQNSSIEMKRALWITNRKRHVCEPACFHRPSALHHRLESENQAGPGSRIPDPGSRVSGS